MAQITARAKIKKLPYDSNGALFSGAEVVPTYSSTTGLAYWDLIIGSTIEFMIENILKRPIDRVIPAVSTHRLQDLT